MLKYLLEITEWNNLFSLKSTSNVSTSRGNYDSQVSYSPKKYDKNRALPNTEVNVYILYL